MPATPRDGEEGVRTRRQAAMDTSREQAISAEEDTSALSAHPAHTTAAPAAPMDMSAILAALQSLKEDQHQALRSVKEEVQGIKEDVIASIDSSMAALKTTVQNLQEDVDWVKPTLKEVQTTLGSYGTTLEAHERLLKELQKTKVLNPGTTPLPITTGGPQFKVPTFDGTSSWTAFRHQFEMVAKGNGWDDGHTLTALTLALRGDALLILENLPEDRRDLSSLIKALESRYGEKHLEHVFRAQLKERTQKSSESLQQWAAEIERLVRRAYASSTSSVNDTVLQAFVDGIRDPEVRAAVRLGHHKTLDAALAHALEVEAVRSDYRLHKVREVVAAVKPRGGPICYGCGERGHIRINCPTHRRRSSASTTTQVDANEDEALN